ncbi:hypothetical protein [Lewinella sp. IMCC34183]|uniref:hypothetical protein n=1 Tax=Lewinella sp. IMCC34183 TaxID=2248762 RepID=UPI000E27E0C4|nr:hypothetical protein [Lewinella sp. IMCC34183]
MLSALIVIIFSTLGTAWFLNAKAKELRHPKSVLWGAYAFHYLLFAVYYINSLYNNSDSRRYYRDSFSGSYIGDSWEDFYGIGSVFIKFMAFPFVNGLGFSYEAMMLLFSFFGFLGILYFYLFMVDKTTFRHRFLGVDFVVLLLFLPNMHFWTVSLGKGGVILMGLGMVFYGLSDIGRRLITTAIGGLLIFHVRPHILLVVLLGAVVASLTSSKGIKTWQKTLIVLVAIAALVPVAGTFLDLAEIDDASADGFTDFSDTRGQSLTKADSGVDIANYNQFMKLFTFWFRPLFVDSPNAMGLLVSVENVFYLILFWKCLSMSFVRFVLQSSWAVKISLVTFFGISFALAQISGNMGIAIRQKSQVMYLFLFIVLAYADYAYRTRGKVIIGE